MIRFQLFLILLILSMGAAAIAQVGPWIITSDYSLFGRVRSLDESDPWTVSGDLATIPGDAVGRHHQGLVYIVGRGGANLIQIYDPAEGFILVNEFSLGDGRNPQDIAFAPDGSAYVSCYDAAVLLRVDLENGIILDTFDTSAYADSDGLPETAWMYAHDGELFITCQLLDRNNWYAPAGPGLLLVFDLATRSWQPPVQLVGEDPYSPIRLYRDSGGQDLLAVGCVGNYTLLDGGIELVNPVTGLSEGYLVTEEDLQGDVLNFVFTGTGSVHALTSSPSFATSVVHLDIAGGGLVVTDASAGYNHADLAWDGQNQLYVADRTVGAAGVRVFSSVTDLELTDSPVGTGLPPFQFIMPAVDDASPVGGVPSGGLTMGLPFPNPCNPTAMIPISGQPGRDLMVSVHDLRGRRVSSSVVRTDGDGQGSFVFTGYDQSGAALAAGVYRVVGRDGAATALRSIVLVK